MIAPKFCAICLEPSDALAMEPLGRGGALVGVCPTCNGEHPRSGRYSFNGGNEKVATHGRTAPRTSAKKGTS